MIVALAVIALVGALAAEPVPSIRVTSEFVAEGPGREILSPALPRNGWSSFHVTVTAPPSTPFTLHIAQNPDDFALVELYQDGIRVMLPLDGTIPEGRTASTFWLDVRLAADVDIRRFKLEPQVFIAESGWIVYPLEARVVSATVPPPADARILFPSPPDARQFAENWLCGARHPLSRNLAQDGRLAAEFPRETADARLLSALGVKDKEAWCKAPEYPPHREWYLGFRDFLLGQAKFRPMVN